MEYVLLHVIGPYAVGIAKFIEDKWRVTKTEPPQGENRAESFAASNYPRIHVNYRSLKIAFYCVTAGKDICITCFAFKKLPAENKELELIS